jgi:hypothetical protein
MIDPSNDCRMFLEIGKRTPLRPKRLPGVEYIGESQLPSGEYTRESQLPSGEYIGESQLPCDEYMNTPENRLLGVL